jgi:hypothetical protein
MEVFCLGSCRTIAPFKYLDREGHLFFSNKEYCWYAHNIKESIQRIEFINNRKHIPATIRYLTMDLDSCNTDFNKFANYKKLADVGVFEVSTRVIKKIENTFVHSTCLSKNKFTNYKQYIQSFDELENDIKILANNFKKIFLVCNIEYNQDLETTHPHRKQLNDFLEHIENRHERVYVLNPNILLKKSENLKTLIKDNNHFSSKFISKLANFYIEKIKAAF